MEGNNFINVITFIFLFSTLLKLHNSVYTSFHAENLFPTISFTTYMQINEMECLCICYFQYTEIGISFTSLYCLSSKQSHDLFLYSSMHSGPCGEVATTHKWTM